MDLDIDTLEQDIYIDSEENPPYQEVWYQKYTKGLKIIFWGTTGKLVQKVLPKQADIDKLIKIIQRKVLKGTHLPVTVKQILAGYLISPYFKALYLYLAQNKLLTLNQQYKRWKH